MYRRRFANREEAWAVAPGLFHFALPWQKEICAMPAPKALGVRRRCLSCAAAFYDLDRTPILCPKCGVEFKVVELPRRAEPFRKYRAPFVSAIKEQPDESLAAEVDPDEALATEDDPDESPSLEDDSEPEPV
jgi:uncharacterized protein (TIGR02300 family)